jgi:hypothetical protein
MDCTLQVTLPPSQDLTNVISALQEIEMVREVEIF